MNKITASKMVGSFIERELGSLLNSLSTGCRCRSPNHAAKESLLVLSELFHVVHLLVVACLGLVLLGVRTVPGKVTFLVTVVTSHEASDAMHGEVIVFATTFGTTLARPLVVVPSVAPAKLDCFLRLEALSESPVLLEKSVQDLSGFTFTFNSPESSSP